MTYLTDAQWARLVADAESQLELAQQTLRDISEEWDRHAGVLIRESDEPA